MRSTTLTTVALASALLVSVPLSGCGPDASGNAATTKRALPSASASASPATPARVTRALAKLEKKHDRRLGLYMLDTGTGRTVTYHADERFGFCSTVKALQTGVLLKTAGDARLNKMIRYGKGDLLANSPITTKHVGTGMSVRDLMKAAIQYSDNTASDLLFEQLGGPAGLRRAMRGLGDVTGRFDRIEPDLSDTPPGTTRDTSTPRAMGTDLRRFLLGTVLAPDRRRLMTTWMRDTATGGGLIRAGVPASWTIADKTGSGLTYGTQNDIAVAWRPHAAPIVIALLTRGHHKGDAYDRPLLAEATRTALPGLR